MARSNLIACLLCLLGVLSVLGGPLLPANAADQPLRIATFNVDATPPIGSRLAYDPLERVAGPLSARGIVLMGKGEPIVLCVVDWLGIANDGQKRWRQALADAAGTTVQRVAVHAVHQHDAPRCDFSTIEVLKPFGLDRIMFDADFAMKAIGRTADAVRAAVKQPKTVTHLGLGRGTVKQVASNRRILGSDGRVRATRYTSCRDPKLRAEPIGIVDDELSLIAFYNEETPLVVLTYFACHPQSYYRTRAVNPDFPGLARAAREEATGGLMHVHFNGAGGDIGAGKWNDGSPKNRPILAARLAQGMADAWADVKKQPITAADVRYAVEPVALPPAPHLKEDDILARIENRSGKINVLYRILAAKDLVWLRRCKAGETIDIGCLTLGPARVLHMPGELLVEYQLAAKKMRPDLYVAMAAYGEYAMGYICLARHYKEGGYEAGRASRTAPEVEGVLMEAMRKLLK